jgi:serine/threonine protein kinase
MTKTRKRYRNNKGGKVIASGGYGCVFNPALKCEGASKRQTNKISKLMTEKNATQEYEEIVHIKEKIDTIPDYENYFLLYDVTLCRPSKLTTVDLAYFNDKCTALPKDNITKENINTKLNDVMSLNLPNGGLPIDDFIYSDGSFEKMYIVHTNLVKLLKNGIIPMNDKNIYHSDIKDSNILIDRSHTTRLIDWGLTVEYIPNKTTQFPRKWRNRPLQFNVPFSVIIFTDDFYEKYTKYLNEGGEIKEENLKPFVVDYLNFWMKKRGAGHYKFINEIMYMLYSNVFTSISEKSRPLMIETEITIPIITNYIVDVLVHYTKFKENGALNLREYLNDVYIKIVDIWGFINVYYPLLEILYNNYFSLKEKEMQLFKKLEHIFNEYMYNPRHEPIVMDDLFNDLKELGNLIYINAYGKKKTSSLRDTFRKTRTHKTKSHQTKSHQTLFNRKKLIKKFKNSFLLSLK